MKPIILLLTLTVMTASCRNTDNKQKTANQNRQMYIDVHHLGAGNVTADAVAEAHLKDLAVQDKHNVEFIKYWVDENAGIVYCLSNASSGDDIFKTHEEAHGLLPDQIKTVTDGKPASMLGKHKLFLDIHELGEGNVTAEAVAEAHEKDLEVQGKYGVNFVNYWVDESQGLVYCLSEAPGEEEVISTHEEAHGLIPNSIKEVIQGE